MRLVELDRETHTYYLDGKAFDGPSPSLILKDLQLSRNYDGLSTYYSERGTAVHVACDLINRDIEIDPTSIDPDIAGYVEAYRIFLEKTGFKPKKSELSLYSELHDFCVTLDVIGDLEGVMTLIDLKTSKSLDPAVEIQLGFQHTAWEENNRLEPIARRMALSLRQDRSYSLKDCSHVSPYLCLDALKLWRWQRSHKRAKSL